MKLFTSIFKIETKILDFVGNLLRKRKKSNIGYIFHHFFEGCRQWGKAKRDQRSMQAHNKARGFSMVTLFFKNRYRKFLRKKINICKKVLVLSKASHKHKIIIIKPNPIHFHETEEQPLVYEKIAQPLLSIKNFISKLIR